MYKLINDFNKQTRNDCVERTDTKTYIPFDPDNTDYQQYLKWLEEGNVPTPADEVSGD